MQVPVEHLRHKPMAASIRVTGAGSTEIRDAFPRRGTRRQSGEHGHTHATAQQGNQRGRVFGVTLAGIKPQ